VLDEVGDWLKVFQDDDFLFVQLQDASNFFQLPVDITDTASIEGGTGLTLDVYSSNQYKRLVYEGLRGITVDGAGLGAALEVGDRLTLLGFFSVRAFSEASQQSVRQGEVGLARVRPQHEGVRGYAGELNIRGCNRTSET